MTTDEIIAMAKEAGLLPDNSHPAPETRAMRQRSNAVQRFAALVAAKEREACALLCDRMAQDAALSNRRRFDADALARSIRARGQKEGA